MLAPFPNAIQLTCISLRLQKEEIELMFCMLHQQLSSQWLVLIVLSTLGLTHVFGQNSDLDGPVYPRQRVCYACFLDEIGSFELRIDPQLADPDDFKCEDVSQLTPRLESPMGITYCVQALFKGEDGNLMAYRGFNDESSIEGYKLGQDFCSTAFPDAIYCYQCDSDLCNNANMWRPQERWFWTYEDFEGHARARASKMGCWLLIPVVLRSVCNGITVRWNAGF
ncbi:hypothetical protein WDU94_007510 [Cyamophila willieti]